MKDKRTEIKQELENTAPFLAGLKEKDKEGFVTPPAYFHNLPDRVLDRLQQPAQSVKQSPRTGSAIITWLGYLFRTPYAVRLATLLLLLAGGLYLLLPSTPSDTEVLFSALSPEEAGNYVSDNLHQFEEELVLEIVREYPDLSVLPAPPWETKETDAYYDELLEGLEEESLKDIL